MPFNKRQQAATERLLAATLTEACEAAKAEIVGFSWLTHEVDYAAFAASLVVVWVFDTQAHKEQALAAGQGARMLELTARALEEADVPSTPWKPVCSSTAKSNAGGSMVAIGRNA